MLKKLILSGGILLLAACGGNNGVDEEVNDEEDDIIVEETSEDSSEESAASDEDTTEEAGVDSEDSAVNDDEPAEGAAEVETVKEDAEVEAESSETTVETVDEEEIDVAAASADKAAFELVKDDTFTNETGQAVWEKYREMTEEYQLRDVYNPEGSGSSKAEIEEMMSDVEVEPDSLDLDTGHNLMIYHFPDDELAHETGEPFIMADMTFIFDEDDHLIHSSIAPGYYELELSDTTSADDLANVTSLGDLAETHDPQVFAIGEMLINEATITQALIPVDAEDNTLGLYVYALGDTIVYSNGDLFFTVSADFPTYSYLYFQDLVQAYGGM